MEILSYPVGSSLPLELPTADWDQPIRRTLVGEPNTLRTLTPEEGEPASTIFSAAHVDGYVGVFAPRR